MIDSIPRIEEMFEHTRQYTYTHFGLQAFYSPDNFAVSIYVEGSLKFSQYMFNRVTCAECVVWFLKNLKLKNL